MPTGTWQATVVDRANEISKGVEGVTKVGALVTVQAPATGSVPISVGLDYGTFQNVYGADWASRLRLVQFPECYLTTPLEEACQAYEELETANDTTTHSITATVDTAADGTTAPASATSTTTSGTGIMQASYTAAATPVAAGDKAVIGAVDSGSGPGGSFKATPLASSGKWTAGGSSGAFTWNYPLAIPPAPAGPAPNISFSYNSQTVDGKTAVSSPQASWIGEGWDYDPGHIQRRYRTCKDDTKTLTAGTPNNTAKANKTSDLCWVSPNAVMSLGGSTTELVRDVPAGGNPETETETYRPAKDDGTRVERRTGAVNGDNNGEYWVVTTTDGTKYYFGQNQVGGGHADTNSVSTVPVFGNHPGEPCYTSTFADSRCGAGKQQAWRWGIDKVEDIHGNVMIVNWSQEANHYAVRDKRNSPEQYDRFAYPKTIEYGMRAAALTNPPAVVEFATAQRCLKTGTVCDAANFAKTDDPGAYRPWWDTPGSLNCKSTSKLCPGFPSFWTQLRLASVTTKAVRAGQSGLGKVDTYTLNQSFPEDWYDTAPSLWLNSLTRRGYAPGDTTGTLQSKDGVSFAHYTVGPRSPLYTRLKDKQLPNLVPTGPGDKRPAFTRPRIGLVATEAGADIEIQYKGGCSTEPASDLGKANGTCFPVRWSPDGEEKTPTKAWFNKYLVHSVTETDKVATLFTKPITTRYSYGGAAWAKSEDEFLRPALRTYSDWRGYRRVAVTKGSSTTGKIQRKSASVTRYFQGTGGEVKDATGTVTLLADDAPQYAGIIAEDLTFRNADDASAYLAAPEGTSFKALNRTLTFPESTQTASRAREAEDGTDLDRLRAFRTLVKRTDNIQANGSSWRGVRSQTLSRDSYGLPSMVESAVVTPNGTGETLTEVTCTNTAFVHNTDAWLIGLLKHKRTTATTCADYANADPASEIKSSTHYSFDGGNYGDAPTKGLVTGVHDLNAAGTAHAITTTNTYDPLGRIRTVTKPLTGKTETQYTPGDTGGAVTTVKTINTLGHATTTTYDPGRALALTVTDPNGRITRTQYDALGRLTGGWSPSRSTGTQAPNVKIAYQQASATPTETRPAATTVETIKDDGTYAKQVTIYDGLLRQVQTQSEAHGPGRVVSDTKYDDHGLVREQTSAYLAQGQPIPKLFKVKSPTLVPSRTLTFYDGLERPVSQETLRVTKLTYITATTYGDTSVTVNPGGSTDPMTTTYTDALGRVVKINHHTGSGKYRSTTYGYDKRGNRDLVKDPAGNAWTYAFDARGRQTVASDPDTGTTKTTYDDADRPTIVTDAQGKSTFTVYDALGRVTSVHEDSLLTDPVKKYTYDRTGLLGLPYESIRHTTTGDYVNRVTGYDTEYRPTGRQTVVPSNAMTTGLSGTYAYSYTYTPTGKPLATTLPAKGGLAAEKVITRYDEDGLPESTSGINWYTSDATYSPYGQVLRSVSSAQPYRVWTTNFIDDHSGRLTRTVTDRERAGPHRVSDTGYSYDDSGSITSVARQDAVTATSTVWDNQCFTYDVLGELVNAWTSKLTPNGSGTGCKAANGTTWGNRTDAASSTGPIADASAATSDAPAGLANTAPDATTLSTDTNSYHQAFTYDWIGNRVTATDRTPAGTTTYTSTYNTTQPHTLASVASTPAGKETSYTYNPTGTTKTRNLPGTAQDQTLQWTAEHKLASNTVGTTKTTYVYDADGNRILEHTPNTGSTLYLGETELTTDTVGLITRASRAYAQAGAPTVVRTTTNQSATGHTLNVLLTDHLGTAHTTVEAGGTQPVTRRAFKPYGEPRGPKPANWPNKRTYLGVGIDDTISGLTHIGAREYDHNTGRFLSADPLIDITDPLQMNGYTYANNSPISFSDPSGLFLDGIGDAIGDAFTGAWHATVDYSSEIREGWNILTGDGEEAREIRASRKQAQENKGNLLNGHQLLRNMGGQPAPDSSFYKISYWVTKLFMPILPGANAAISAATKGVGAGKAVSKVLPRAASNAPAAGDEVGEVAARVLPDCPHSFLPGTEVLMADGTRKRIEDVEIGDFVLTTDIKSGKNVPRRVTETIQTETDKEFTELTIATSADEATLTATSTHPFWVPELDSWIEAGDLANGQFLRTSAGTHVQITAVKHYTKGQRTHDLTIDDLHAYYVLAGATPVLVHNCNTSYQLSLDTRAAVGSGNAQAYQIAHTGATEYRAVGGGERVWADGFDRNTGELLDAKFIEKPGRSPFIPGSGIPDFIRSKITAKMDDEFSRYAAVINDPSNPLTGLRVITNHSGAVPYFQGLMQQHGIPGSVVVR
ncbi:MULTISPECIES: polymorphic toxin-type HINT domain-containing protein [unclassified Streptomyces]|uniref:polymorphic toxin-type HINT domain-containing protein n=1 Tax=unclassified Streptomyces TaxID=2593676 RepID=UPI001F107057|nr:MULTISPECIES: polymorphic toxin-type HINT domain-containing protein [unclassified Streptomyces]